MTLIEDALCLLETELYLTRYNISQFHPFSTNYIFFMTNSIVYMYNIFFMDSYVVRYVG